jgi:hypothetical protein
MRAYVALVGENEGVATLCLTEAGDRGAEGGAKETPRCTWFRFEVGAVAAPPLHAPTEQIRGNAFNRPPSGFGDYDSRMAPTLGTSVGRSS